MKLPTVGRDDSSWLTLLVVCMLGWTAVESACPVGWSIVSADNSTNSRVCIQFVTDTTLSFTLAHRNCQSKGGYLARVTTAAIDAFISRNLPVFAKIGLHSRSYWIGLTDNNKNAGPWTWIGGPALGNFTSWWNTPFNRRNKPDCVYYLSSLPHKWIMSSDCTIMKGFICMRDFNSALPVTTSTPANTITCPRFWIPYQAKKTCLYFSRGIMTYSDARGWCKRSQADLVVIPDAAMNTFITDEVRRHKASYFIGLHSITKNRTFVWNDQTTAANFTFWGPNQPNNYLQSQDCVVIWTSTYKWNDDRCSTRTKFICQRDPLKKVVTARTLPRTLSTVSQNCGAGWEENKGSPYCYQFNENLLSWTAAGAKCVKEGGHLASIHSSDEQSYLTGRTVTLSQSFYWIGANDRSSEGGYQWTDRGPFQFLNWDQNQPDNKQDEDCVGMVPGSGKWDDLPCNTQLGYICQKIGKRKPPTISPPTTPFIPAGKKWGCEQGWRAYRRSCYGLFYAKTGVTWYTARKYCQTKESAELVSIHDFFENAFIYSTRPKGYKLDLWIGFNDLTKENTFTWSDNSPVTYTAWDRTQPNNLFDQDCVIMYSNKYGRWNDAHCTRATQKLLMCKKSKEILSNVSTALQDGCPPSMFGYNAKCYGFQSTPMTFSAAEANCKSIKGHLATVNDKFVQSFLAPLISKLAGSAYWIGLSSTTAANNVLTWTSGAQLLFTNWARGQTGSKTNYCVSMRVAPPTGLWLKNDCTSSSLPFICEVPRQGYTDPPPVVTTTPTVACPAGWVMQGQMCYKAFGSSAKDDVLSWREARTKCGSYALGGTLVTIGSKKLETLLSDSVVNGKLDQTVPYWIGLNDLDVEDGHKWLDNAPVTWTHWGYGEPNDRGNREDCVEWKKGTVYGVWNDVLCSLSRHYICQFPRGSPLYTQRPTVSIGPTGGQCGGSDWSLFQSECYYISPEGNDSSTVSWFRAREICHGMGAELVSIGKDDVNNYIAGIISIHSTFSFWIGMNDIDSSVYRWVDGTPLTYISWADGEPNDFQGLERCVEMASDGFWNDRNCNEKRGYICKRLPGNVHPTIHPTPQVTGGCPPGYSTHPNATHCFYIVKTPKSFENARKVCESLSSGGTLASINNQIEQDLVITLMYGLSASQMFIGLSDKRKRGTYEWIDNSQPQYVNWKPNSPTGLGRSVGCITMIVDMPYIGKWDDHYCGSSYPFLCQTPKNPALPDPLPDPSDCPPDYVRFANSCYKAYKDSFVWSEAELVCKGDNGHLASVTDIYESTFFNLLTADIHSAIWTGLRYDVKTDLYKWTDNWPVFHTQWGVDQPLRQGGGGCISANVSTYWEDISCLTTLPFVCEQSKGTPPPPTGAVYGICPEGWTSDPNGYCYFAQEDVKNTRAWAHADCGSKGGTLASISSDQENKDYVVDLFRYYDVVWIGLTQGTTSGYKWDDGSAVDYTNFMSNQPDPDEKNQEDCVVGDTLDGKWTTISCSEKHGYLCKKLQKGQTTAATTTATITTMSTQTQKTQSPGTTGKLTTQPSVRPATTPKIKTNPLVTQPTKARTVPGVKTSALPTVTPQGQRQSNGKDDKLSGGAVAGIVIGVIVAIAIAVLVVVFVRKGYANNLRSRLGFQNESMGGGIDNVMYSNSGEISMKSNA